MPVGRPISLTPNVATQSFTVTATAGQTSFTVTNGYRLNELGVYRNGVRLIQGKDFTASDGSTVTLLSGAVLDDVIEFQIFDSFNVANALVSYGNQSISGNLTATAFIGDGSSITGVAATDNINTNNIKVSGISTLGTETTVVGSAVTFDASGGTIVGVLTATSFSGDGTNLGGIAGVGVTARIDSASLTVSGIATFNGVGNFDAEVTAAGGVDVTGGVKSAGIVSFTNTTASTSTTTGALIVSGGVGIAGSLHVGENVSVGGTLTYEDVTNIDSVGLITARLGVNVSGGEIAVGAAFSVGQAGIATAAGFVGPLTGAVTGNADTATTATNLSGGTVSGSTGTFTGDVDIADKIVHTGDTNTALRFPSADTITAETAGTKRLEIDSSGKIKVTGTRGGALQPEDDDTLQLYTSASDNSINRGCGLTFYNHDNSGYEQGGTIQVAKENGTADNEAAYMRFNVRPAGATNVERLRITSTGAISFNNGELVERCYIQSSPAWSSNGAVDLDNGVVQYNTSNYGSGGAGSLYFTSSVGINTQMSTGDIMSLTMMTNVNSTAGYINNIFIDGQAATETWVGGSAPTAGGGSGVDIYTFNIIKTASATYTVIANQVLTSS